jgi:hypothetical protein
MIKLIERISDSMTALVVPKADAAAACPPCYVTGCYCSGTRTQGYRYCYQYDGYNCYKVYTGCGSNYYNCN